MFSADAGVLIVDEPETHLHSLLAARLWNELEDARLDIRFVYVTHDLTFALSRRDAAYVLSSPTDGLKIIELQDDLPAEVASTLLGVASLSFYASRVVFCEGDLASLDAQLYGAWFNGRDTVVRPVDSCQSVIRAVQALQGSGIASGLETVGIIDRDYHATAFIAALPVGIHALPVHEIESLLATPAVVGAIALHTARTFDATSYLAALRQTVNDAQRDAIVVRRWKTQLEGLVIGVVAGISASDAGLDDLGSKIPATFDVSQWERDPSDILQTERTNVASAVATGSIDDLLAIVPGKQLLPVAASTVGMQVPAYTRLTCEALRSRGDANLETLKHALIAAFTPLLPSRVAAAPPAKALPEPS